MKYPIPESEDTVTEALVTQDASDQHPYISSVPVVPQLFVALGLLVGVFGITYIGVAGSITQSGSPENSVAEILPMENESRERAISDFFNDITLEAKSAVVWDVKNQKILFNKNADLELPLASVTKLMTALIAYELLAPNTLVEISEQAIMTEGESGLTSGEKFTAQDIIDLTLISSSNDGAFALSAAAGSVVFDYEDPERIFVQAMNIKAEELGLLRTKFYNSTGLDISETEAGAYGTARDMAHLMSYIITGAYDAVTLTNIDVVKISNQEGAFHLVQNTNPIVTDIDGLIASKTGYTELAGGNLVVAFNSGLNRPIVIAVLGSSYQGRFKDTQELFERTQSFIASEE